MSSFRNWIVRARTGWPMPSIRNGPKVRFLSLHEYQSQDLLQQYEIPVPEGRLAQTPAEAQEIVRKLGGKCVLKSQILAGGRGKGTFSNDLKGGIQMVTSSKEAFDISGKMLGKQLATKQTGPDGYLVDKLYVTKVVKYSHELYFAMTIDRERYSPAIVVSTAGGVDIETVAKESPELLHKYWFSLSQGITPELISRMSADLGFSPKEEKNLGSILYKMLRLFVAKDATLLEINPLVRTTEGDLICLDAKFNFDNAAEPRQAELFAMGEASNGDVNEQDAKNAGLVYIQLDGNIGNLVNGAGLAMATNDAISLYGGKSANFLDAGGQATKDTMITAFEIILRDPRLKVILVNIYGGIIRCDMIAEAIIGAADVLGPLKVPLVIRLEGTNSEAGLKLIAESGLGLHTESGFGEAAQRAVELAQR